MWSREILFHFQLQAHSMIGCLKKAEPPERKPESKYYSPTDLIPDPHLPPYFSGAGYFMSKSALSKILPIRDTIPILHLDDVYVGKLIKAAGLSDEMLQSVSICIGVQALGTQWELRGARTTPCLMSGLTVFHRFVDPKEMAQAFKLLKRTENRKTCVGGQIETFAARWTKNATHTFIADEFIIMSNNYANL